MLMINMNEQEIKTTKLYVSNIPVESDRHSLTAYFNQYGRVLQCSILFKNTKYAFIHYASMEDVENVLRNSNKLFLNGQKLTIRLSRTNYRNDTNSPTYSSESSPYNRRIESKLYVTNLPENCNESELRLLFEKYGGSVVNCVIMWNHYAFIHFHSFKDANLALDNLDGYLFNGKHLNVQLSNQYKENKTSTKRDTSINNESSILCYRASDSESSAKQPTDWIQLIENGSLPVVSDDTEQFIDCKSLILSDIPTPECPDFFSVKIPAIKKPLSPTPHTPVKTENDLLKDLIKQINEKDIFSSNLSYCDTNSSKMFNYLLFPQVIPQQDKYLNRNENVMFSMVKNACYAK